MKYCMKQYDEHLRCGLQRMNESWIILFPFSVAILQCHCRMITPSIWEDEGKWTPLPKACYSHGAMLTFLRRISMRGAIPMVFFFTVFIFLVFRNTMKKLLGHFAQVQREYKMLLKYSHQCDYSWCGYICVLLPIDLFCYYLIYTYDFGFVSRAGSGRGNCWYKIWGGFTLCRLFKAHFCQSLSQLQSVSLQYNSTCYVTTNE